MSCRFLLFFITFLWQITSFAQQEFEFVGVVRIGEEAFISYKISFEEKDGYIKGYSLTDLGGAHETKSFLSGYFDDDKNTLEFYESGILYTKSYVTQDDFCFIHFKGDLSKLNERQTIEGLFKGLYSDGKECISGELKLANLGRILKKAKRIDRKIDRSIVISQEKKDQVNLVKDLDSLSMNTIRKDQILSVFTASNKINLTYYDAGQEDGDQIAIYVNDELMFRKLEAKSKKQKIEIPLLKEKTVVKIEALNNGSIGGNTIKIDLYDTDHTIETITNMKSGESAKFVFIQKK